MFLQKKCDNNNSISIDTEKRKSNSNNIKLFPLRPNYLRKNESKENKEQYILKSFSNNKGSKNNENSYFPIASSCPLGLKCPFYKKYCKLKNELIILLSSITKIKNFNQSLLNSLSKRSFLYYNVISENEELKKILNKLTNRNKILDYSSKEEDFDNKMAKTEINNKSFSNTKNNFVLSDYNFNYAKENNVIINSKTIFNSKFANKLYSPKKLAPNRNSNINLKNSGDVNNYYSYNLKNPLEYSPHKYNQKRYNPNNLRASILSINNNNPHQHYELLHQYSKQQNQKLVGDNSKFSFLSTNIDYVTMTRNNENLINLEQLTKNDENFLRTISDSSNEVLLKYNDMILILTNDYKEMIKLCLRMKDFIKGTNKLVDSVVDSNPSKILIENTCFILKCDRASLFILDKVSDSLIVYSGEGIKKAQIKIPKDKGIVGACFLERRKIRIDDAYLDKRFNKDVDKKTNYRTKSILCYPLIDKEGECIGVIEAINKYNSLFSEDDEELLKLLAYQAGIIFRNLSLYDDNKFMIMKLNIILDYNQEINFIKNKFDFTEKTEDTLLNLFSCVNSAFYFIEDNKLKRYKENKILTYDINTGVVGKAIKLKEILTYQTVKNCAEFNNNIDISSLDGLLTFPIMGKKNKIVKAVVQVPYMGKVYKTGKPNENEVKIIKKLRKCIKNWIEINIVQNENNQDD